MAKRSLSAIRRRLARKQSAPFLVMRRHQRWRATRFKMQNGVCHYCGQPMRHDVTLDHVIPLSKGGADEFENTVAAHAACNYEKADRISPVEEK